MKILLGRPSGLNAVKNERIMSRYLKGTVLQGD